MTEGNFHLSYCAVSFSVHLISWENRECFVRTVPAPEICEYPIVLHRAVECVWLVVVVQSFSSSFSL